MLESVRIPVRCSRAAQPLRLSIALAVSLFACTLAAPRDVTELVVQDSTYLNPETMLPYSGPVFRNFPDEEGRTQFEATLRDGTWEGEFTVYHESGRVRHQGEMSGGAQCGGWIENEDPSEPETVYEAIKQDLEALVIYPDCPGG